MAIINLTYWLVFKVDGKTACIIVNMMNISI